MLPVAADVERKRWNGVPVSLYIHAVRGGIVARGDILARRRELLVRHAVELSAEDIDHAVHRLRLGAVTDLVVVDPLRLGGTAAQIIEAGEVNTMVDTAEHGHLRGELVVRSQGPGAQGV